MLDSPTNMPHPVSPLDPSQDLEAQSPAIAHGLDAWPMTLARVLTLVGLLASAVTGLIHQGGNLSLKMCIRETPTSCETVISSRYGEMAGIPLPFVGLAFFSMMLVLLLFPKSRGAVLLTPLALAGAAAGVDLMMTQVYLLGTLCIVCLAANVTAVALGGLLLVNGLLSSRATVDLSRAARWNWFGAAIFVLVMSPSVWITLSSFSVCD